MYNDLVPLMHGEQNSMESNIPVVGGEEPNQDVSQHAEPHAEGASNGTTSATLPAYDESAPDELMTEATDIQTAPEYESQAEPADEGARGDPFWDDPF